MPIKHRVLVPHCAQRSRTVRVQAYSSTDLVTISHYVGKSITLFVGFYCTLQWMYYKELNKNEKKK